MTEAPGVGWGIGQRLYHAPVAQEISVRVVQHVFRRGAVYWWRRRLLKKTGESELVPIAISLRTRDLSKARTIAAHLAVASDGILRQEGRDVLSAIQVRSILESVARTHLAKLDRLAALETADGITADDGRASDRAMGWARRLQASQGIAAAIGNSERRVLAANGLSPEQIEEVAWTLDLLRESSGGSFPRQKLIALLEACGAPKGEGDIQQAERICYRGQAAALLSVDRRWSGEYREDDNVIERLLSSNASVSTVVTVADQPKHHLPTSNANEVETAAEPTRATPAPSSAKEASITELAENLIKEKAKLGEWNSKTQRQVRSLVETFVEMIGDDHVRSLSQSRVAEYRSLLLALPKTYGKGQNDRKTPLSVWLERAKALPDNEVGRESGTLNRHLTQLQEVLVYIEACGHKIREFSGVSKLLSKKKGRARDERNPFSPQDLTAIFRQPPWTGCEGLESRLVPGPVIYHDALSIVPYLARYTLGRREELCGLDVEDVLEEDGIPYIFIRPNKHRTLKNPQSKRRIPVVDEVVRLGFLRYHAEIKARGYKLLFPELRAASDRTPLGDVFYGDWIKVQNAAVPNAAEERKVFHSFRKTGGADLKDAGVASELRADILGHGGDNITEERYVSSAKLKQMFEALQKPPIVTAHIEPREICLRPDILQKRARPSARPRRRTYGARES
jgi:integrase